MLAIAGYTEQIPEWTPPKLPENMIQICEEKLWKGNVQSKRIDNGCEWLDQIVIFRVEPYIDVLFLRRGHSGQPERFVFHPGYRWDYETEEKFVSGCLSNPHCICSFADMDEIYAYYSDNFPQWHLKRYYTKPVRLLDHIYHCMQQNTSKEMLYKAGLDELAMYVDEMDEINLLATKPSALYDDIPIKVLRMMNCSDGARVLTAKRHRQFVKQLYKQFPDIFTEALNDAQCRYLERLIDGNMEPDEVGRLYLARKKDLSQVWCKSQYEIFMADQQYQEETSLLKNMDPIYKEFIAKRDMFEMYSTVFNSLRYYLIYQREDYDKRIRRANRKRDESWQERNHEYVIRYPQTIHDFCREAVYMRNCLITYVEPMIHNDTTILFMRKASDVNQPFITIEIFRRQLMQARHRFNEVCSDEELQWIFDYCDRHGIRYNQLNNAAGF